MLWMGGYTQMVSGDLNGAFQACAAVDDLYVAECVLKELATVNKARIIQTTKTTLP